MVRINKDLIQNEAQETAFNQLLKSDFDADVQKYYHFKGMTLMYVKGDKSNMDRVAALPEVVYVEPNMLMYTTQACAVEGCPGVWGLDRVDSLGPVGYSSPLDTSAAYNHGEDTGAGVNAYIIDTGILITHVDFEGRATWGFTGGQLGDEDGNGHGTHCAGTVGGRQYGVAKAANLIAVKVMTDGGAGSVDTIVEGMQWVQGQHAAGENSVANMSLGGGISVALDNAVADMYNAGVVVVCAAGNSNADACNSSPGRAPEAITVCATNVDDVCASFSNWGSCVDICAPGESILSTWIGSDTATNRISGTSMACPHVVGGAARWMSANGTPTPAQVASGLTGSADTSPLASCGVGTPNLSLYVPCPI